MLFLGGILQSCNIQTRLNKQQEKVNKFFNCLMKKDYSICMKMLQPEIPCKDCNCSEDTLTAKLDKLRASFVDELGEDFKIFFLKDTSVWFNSWSGCPPGYNYVFMECYNKTHYGLFYCIVSQNKEHILGFTPTINKRPIPELKIYIAIYLIGFLLVLFNIYVIIKIIQSNLRLKWLKVLLVFILFIPIIGYDTFENSTFYPFFHPTILGVYFKLNGFNHSVFIFAFPLGAFRACLQYRKELFKPRTKVEIAHKFESK